MSTTTTTTTTVPRRAGRARLSQVGLPLLLVGAVMTMVIPLPPVLLDVLLAANITLAVVVVLAVLTLRDTLDLSAFPSLLLIATLMRLALNVSSTRLILLDGYAGKVIETFGNFVVGGSVIVGLVVFLILVVIQFVVITSGAGRVAEVAARFALDAMPGKQMAIDADLAAGLIDEQDARRRRTRLAQESDFYGAMDGASKFVKGDAIAGIVIVVINLLGGFAIGVVSAHMSLSQAMSTYSLLTVGDGLVSQIPALLLSVSTGLLVARVGDDENGLGSQLGRQLLRNAQALKIAGGVVGGMALLPGLPKIPFLLLGVSLFVISGRVGAVADEAGDATEDTPTVRTHPDDPEALIGRMRVEPIELHLAYDVLDLVDPARGGDLLERVRALRGEIATELGIVMPLVRTRDDVSLPPEHYRILLHGVEVATGRAPRDRVLALPAGEGVGLGGIPSEQTVEPVFGLTAYWVPAEAKAAAAATGATVVDRSSVVVTHLAETVRAHAAGLLSRQQVQQLVEALRFDEPLLANDVGTESLPVGLLHGVLRSLLEERVSVRDLARIIDAVAAAARDTRNLEQLASAARVAVGSAIVARIAPDRRLGALTLAPELESHLHQALRDIDGTMHLVVDPTSVATVTEQATAALARAEPDRPVAIVCGQLLRGPLHRLLGSAGLDVPVLAYPELPSHLDVIPIGVIDDHHDS